MVILTEKESALLVAIYKSEFNDATHKAWVWVDCLWGFESKKLFGGVMASLTKKELVLTDGEVCCLTDAGLATMQAIRPVTGGS
jgi:hypothetical protein